MQKQTNSFFLILRLLTYLYRKKNCQICQSYDVINIFFKWEATIPIRLFDRAYFFGL
jgi:hypothetical protein